MTSDVVIRRAGLTDVESIIALADARAVDPGQRPDAERGFLVSRFDRDTYERLVATVDHAYVLEDDGEIQAFVIGYSDHWIDPGDLVGQAIRRHMAAPFVLIKQVCVALDRMGRGYARTLYDAVRQASVGLPCCAAVVLDPPNDASVAFHESVGFRKILELSAPDGMQRGVWATTGNQAAAADEM